jgi:hypothetical protein
MKEQARIRKEFRFGGVTDWIGDCDLGHSVPPDPLLNVAPAIAEVGPTYYEIG